MSPNVSVTGICIEGNQFELRVQDNGIGINAKSFAKIPESFQRLYSHDSEFQGTNHIESELDKGSCFIIRIPFKEVHSR